MSNSWYAMGKFVAMTALLFLTASNASAYTQSGIASYYWQPQKVASGGNFNPQAMTAAHKTLPFGSKVKVTHKKTGRSIVVTINDRGPFIKGRIIDLSLKAAQQLGIQNSGIAPVHIAVVGKTSLKAYAKKSGTPISSGKKSYVKKASKGKSSKKSKPKKVASKSSSSQKKAKVPVTGNAVQAPPVTVTLNTHLDIETLIMR
ncbi:MAG: septal ring lytic transglycosylase RlpA family protein [Methyloligellaceae bacterium]